MTPISVNSPHLNSSELYWKLLQKARTSQTHATIFIGIMLEVMLMLVWFVYMLSQVPNMPVRWDRFCVTEIVLGALVGLGVWKYREYSRVIKADDNALENFGG